MSNDDLEERLRIAIKNSIDAELSPQTRRVWFDYARELHSQRDEETIKRMEASWEK